MRSTLTERGQTVVLDAYALLALRDDESGADEVADLQRPAQRGRARCPGCFMTRMEVPYRVWKVENEVDGRLALAQIQALPIEWLYETPELLEAAALVHKDPEFESLANCAQRLPYKSP